MEEYEEMAAAPMNQLPAPRRRGPRWLLMGGLAIAFMFALAVGVFLGTSTGSTQAAALSSGASSSTQSQVAAQNNSGNDQALIFSQSSNGRSQRQPFNNAPGGSQGRCESLTVTSVNGGTIVAKTASGSTVTIHTTASTMYTQAGKKAAESALKAGDTIMVMGTHNSDGSITATSIDIG